MVREQFSNKFIRIYFSGTCQRGDIDWQYKTVPQQNSHFSCNNQQSNWPRGKVLGGCSSINYMQFVRGDPHDYDNWQLPGWSFKEILPYFKKLERVNGESIPKNDQFRNHNLDTGMMDVSLLEDTNQTCQLFIEACEKNGLRQTEDYNAEESLIDCVGKAQISTKNGKRWSTASGYLLLAVERDNLDILINAHTCRVEFDANKQVTGREFEIKIWKLSVLCVDVIVKRQSAIDKEEFIRGKEVILSAGAIGSPQILLLSGIGPQEELKKLDIPVIVDLPGVGKNLRDHLFTIIFYLCNVPTLSASDLTKENLQKWTTEGRGVLSSSGNETEAWFQVNDKNKNRSQVPNIQLQFCPITVDAEICKNFNFKPEVYEQYFKPHLSDNKQWTVGVLATLLYPKSSGEITLASRNPFDHPIIDPKYLEDPDDLRVLIAACKKADQICQSEPLKKVIQSFSETFVKSSTKENEDQFWEEYIRNYSLTDYHPLGTCKMGQIDDPMSVVTPDTKAKGVKGLRVVDASIIPDCPSGNTNIPIIAVSERAADFETETRCSCDCSEKKNCLS